MCKNYHQSSRSKTCTALNQLLCTIVEQRHLCFTKTSRTANFKHATKSCLRVHSTQQASTGPEDCLSTSLGMPDAPAAPARLMMMAPVRPAYVSATSAVCEWYIHITDDGSAGPGPAREGTCTQRCVLSAPVPERAQPCHVESKQIYLEQWLKNGAKIDNVKYTHGIGQRRTCQM